MLIVGTIEGATIVGWSLRVEDSVNSTVRSVANGHVSRDCDKAVGELNGASTVRLDVIVALTARNNVQ